MNKKATIKQIAEALQLSGGFQTPAADMLGITQSAISRRIKSSAELKKIVAEIENQHLDRAESALMAKIGDKDLGAICFYLKCKGKNRGYIEKQIIDTNIKTQGRLQINVIEDKG